MFTHHAVRIRKRTGLSFLLALLLVGFSACMSSTPTLNEKPIRIGYSASLTGTYSGQGKALVQGFELWRDTINRGNGLLGHPVVLVGLDDGSKPAQVKANYEKLISQEHVDLLFGPYSSLLTLPAATVAQSHKYALFAPTGSAPSVFSKHFNNIFVTTLPSQLYLKSFSAFILALPQSMRPHTASYVTVNNPFTMPPVKAAQNDFVDGGMQTVFAPDPYPVTADITDIATKIVHANADIVVLGTSGLKDCVSFIKAFKAQHYNPRAIIATSGPNEGLQFVKEVGNDGAEGVFVTKPGWYPGAPTYQNDQFTHDYLAKFGGMEQDISATTSEAYSAGQLLEQAVNSAGSFENAKLIETMHTNTFNSLQGPAKFDENGGNTLGVPYLFQWQQGALIPVYPDSQAQANAQYPKKPWS